ncbi:MAG: histidine kinase dimerization/phospho-acceptor domain-containing protein [Candidatus Methylomirabilales bacterium]
MADSIVPAGDPVLRLDPLSVPESSGGPSDQTIREFCHDLRQPIATISALAEAARILPGIPNPLCERLEQILCEARQMSEMIAAALEEAPGRRLQRVWSAKWWRARGSSFWGRVRVWGPRGRMGSSAGQE